MHCLELARRGIVGTRKVFLGPRGFLATHYPLKNDAAKLTDGLGERWEWLASGTKACACCLGSHASITGALDLMKEHDIAADLIERIDCEMHPTSVALVAEPHELKWNPKSRTEAQFSHPFSLATAILRRRLMPADCTHEQRTRGDVRELMDRISVRTGSKDTGPFSATVHLATKDGRRYSRAVADAYGSPENPLGWDGEIEKFRACSALSARPLAAADVDSVIDMCRELEAVDDVTQLTRLLSCGT